MATASIYRVDSQQGRYDDDKVREAISLAQSVESNRTATVVFSARYYHLTAPLIIAGNVSLVSDGAGRRATTLRFERGLNPGVDLVHFQGGFGNVISNMSIETPAGVQQTAANVSCLRLNNVSSFTAENLELQGKDLGPNSSGVLVEGRESVVIRDFNATASRGIVVDSGDNIRVYNFDIQVSGSVRGDDATGTQAKLAGIQGTKSFAGNFVQFSHGTIQRGEHAVYIDSNVAVAGGSLVLQDVRYEQGLIDQNRSNAAWHVRIRRDKGHGFERLIMRGCRNSPRESPATHLSGASGYTIDTGNVFHSTSPHGPHIGAKPKPA
tara:strand:- start:259630 stop:260598 length:969 start_codon:yes stop_codon:yes gene_type:complete